MMKTPSGETELAPASQRRLLSTTPVRVDTPLVSEDEMHRVTSHWRNLATAPRP